MSIKTINIAEDFSPYPAGRDDEDGKGFHGERFRELFLIPALSDPEIHQLRVVLDGAETLGGSFLEEAFGGLIRRGFKKRDLRNRLEIVAGDDAYEIFKRLTWKYIEKAKGE
ncbi:STAS-like domain-containing protein [Maricaulis sp.]|uniref:STAS-like domain-containing protein n=1 Tax=Maricaulis sp. TaxID=1486257 RepID=UPI003A8FF31D